MQAVEITCPVCGSLKSKPGPCRGCKRATVRIRERDLQFWLRWAGVDTGGMGALNWCALWGVPQEIQDLAKDIW